MDLADKPMIQIPLAQYTAQTRERREQAAKIDSLRANLAEADEGKVRAFVDGAKYGEDFGYHGELLTWLMCEKEARTRLERGEL